MIEKYIILSLRPIIYDLEVKKKFAGYSCKKYCGQHLKTYKRQKKQAFPVCIEMKFQKTWISLIFQQQEKDSEIATAVAQRSR